MILIPNVMPETLAIVDSSMVNMLFLFLHNSITTTSGLTLLITYYVQIKK